MPCPSTGPKMFNAGPTLLSWSKNSIAFSAFLNFFMPAQKPNLLNLLNLFGTKLLGLPQIVYQFLVWPKKFGPAQNSLGPAEGRGISMSLSFH